MTWQCFSNNSSPTLSELLRTAEATLLRSSLQENPNLQIHDKDVVIPNTLTTKDDSPLTIHTIQVTNPKLETPSPQNETPVVMLHGFMNGGAYFYRNFGGLGRSFRKVYALDMLGWGLSSRPTVSKRSFQSSKDAEDWYVESIEAWRKEEQVPRMHLVGHSMGGYMAAAYAERYPDRIQTLTLLSPVGVPEEDLDEIAEKRKNHSWAFRFVGVIFRNLFAGVSPGDLIRSVPNKFAQQKCLDYVTARIPDITDPDEQKALADYLYYNNAHTASGERLLPLFLTQNAFAKDPMIHRIPRLRIPKCTFLYGARDWMDIQGGIATKDKCRENFRVQVAQVPRAGHLLMLDNPKDVNQHLVEAILGSVHGQ